MSRTELRLRPLDIPTDYGRIAEIYSASFWSPTTAAALAAEESTFPVQGERHRLACVDASDLVVAYGSLVREGHEEPGHYGIRVAVDAKHRRQGIGDMVLAELERLASERGATRLDARFRDDPPFLSFAQRHGYAIHERSFGWSLNVAAFDETPFTGVLTRLASDGLRFVTLAENDPQLTPEALYELERHANHDEPGYEDQPFIHYDQWHRETYESEDRPLDCTIVAMDGARPVAMSGVAAQPNGNMRVTFTGVHRDYRGRGLAQAVKLLAIRTARHHGAAWLGTGNSERNAALLHVNARFGFEPRPGMYWCMKDISKESNH